MESGGRSTHALHSSEQAGLLTMPCTSRVDVVKHKMDHLSCFIPAMLALGAHAGAVKEEKAKRYMQVRLSSCQIYLVVSCWIRSVHVMSMTWRTNKANGVVEHGVCHLTV